MLVCGALTLAFMLSILLSLEAGPLRTGAALGFAALAPLLHRLGDALAVRPLAGGAGHRVAGRVRRRTATRRRGHARAGGLGEALPGWCSLRSRQSGSGAAAVGARRSCASACSSAYCALCFLPFLVLSPHGLWHSITDPDEPPAPDRVVRRGGAARRTRGRRARDHDEVEPRLAEPGRDGGPTRWPRCRRSSRLRRSSPPGSGSRAARSPGSGSYGRRRRRSARSSPSARCSRPSS